MSGAYYHFLTAICLDDPAHSDPFVGGVTGLAGPACRRRRFVRAAFELSGIVTALAMDQARPVRQVDLENDAADEFFIPGQFGDIAWQPAGVLDRKRYLPQALTNGRYGLALRSAHARSASVAGG